jgi:UDP-glucose 4-epimerase
VFDNLSRGHADACGPAQLVIGDLRHPDEIERCFAAHSFDLVMHFAALAYVGESVSEPEIYYQNNVVGTLNLLATMLRHSVKKLVFSSTCATYGEPEHWPIREDHPQRPINPYGQSKWMIEQVLRDFAHAYSLASISLRYFNAAGCDPAGRCGERHEPETHLIPLVLAEAMRVSQGGATQDSALKVFGNDFATPDGSCIRDYIHVADLCRAHLLAAQRLLAMAPAPAPAPASTPAPAPAPAPERLGAEFFNLANGAGFSVFEVIRACEAVTGFTIAYQVNARRAGDPGVLVGDSAKAERVLGWRPQIPQLDAIVRTAWQWMRTPPRL